jgi:undecaprenyl pyrophosphate synthase
MTEEKKIAEAQIKKFIAIIQDANLDWVKDKTIEELKMSEGKYWFRAKKTAQECVKTVLSSILHEENTMYYEINFWRKVQKELNAL